MGKTAEEKKEAAAREQLARDKVPNAKYFVADNKSISCIKGILGPGKQVFPKDFPGGEATIREHVKNGGIVVK